MNNTRALEIPGQDSVERSKFKSLSDEQLLAAFSRDLEASYESFLSAAEKLREMRWRGIDVSFVPPSCASILEKLATGQLLPKLFVQVASQPTEIIRRFASYSTIEQERILKAGGVRRVVIVDGQPDVQFVPLSHLNQEVSRQCLGLDGEVPEGMQRQWMLTERAKLGEPQAISPPTVRFDKKRHAIIIQGVRYSSKQLREWLKNIE